MSDIVLESIRVVFTGLILGYLWWIGRKEQLYRQPGWWYIIAGFALIFLGGVVDIIGNFSHLNNYVIIGDTVYEKTVGYLLGPILIFVGLRQWFPHLAALRRTEQDLERSTEKLETLVQTHTDELKQVNEQLRQRIKEHEQSEQALRESEERFRAIADANPVPIVISRISDGLILYANAHLALTFGYSSEELLGHKTPVLYDDPADRQVMLAALKQSGYLRSYEVRARKADGTPFWVIASLQTITFDGEPALLSGFYDITERRQAEETLRASEAKNRALLNAIPDMMFVINRDGTYLDFNPAQGQEPLLPPTEFLGKNVSEVIPPDLADQTMHYVEQTLQSGTPQIFEYQLPRQDGTIRHYEARLVVCCGVEVLAIVRDITQRKTREALIEAERARIARDLHDGLAQSLYQLGLKVDYRRQQADAVPTAASTDIRLPDEPINVPDIAPLTELELDILGLVAQGLSNGDIGAQVGLAEKTISNRLTMIFNKLHVDNRVQATLFALREGLVSLDEADTG